jgi:anti-anti-sigma regulatory factor
MHRSNIRSANVRYGRTARLRRAAWPFSDQPSDAPTETTGLTLRWSESRDGDRLVVTMSGDVDDAVTAELRLRLLEAMAQSDRLDLSFDMSEVSSISERNAALFMLVWSAATEQSRPIRIDGLHGDPAATFGALGLR